MNWSRWKTSFTLRYNELVQGQSQNMKNIIRDVAITLLIAVVVYFGLRTAVQSFRVEGPSMLPNFETGQWVLVNKVVYKLHVPQRGDVIIFRSPHDRNKNLIKRVNCRDHNERQNEDENKKGPGILSQIERGLADSYGHSL